MSNAVSHIFTEAATRAALRAMRILSAIQRGEEAIDITDLKPADNSLVTSADYDSEQIMKSVLRAALPNVPILGEEQGWTALSTESDYFITLDPIDGTRSFATGAATSTVMLVLYSQLKRQVVAAVIGHPATGRIWVANESGCYRHMHGSRLSDEPFRIDHCNTWPGNLSPTSSVLIDKFRPFKAHAGTKQVFLADGCKALYAAVYDQMILQSYCSNGFHQALVADGAISTNPNIGVAASLTLGMGSWWDCAGALLVVRAGGVVRGFCVNESRELEIRDGLDPTSYDILLTANNQETLEHMSDILTHTFA